MLWKYRRDRPDRLKPREPSWGKILLGLGLGTLALRTFMTVMVFSTTRPPEADAEARCLNNMRQMLRAARLYAQDYDSRLPRDEAWVDQTMPYNNREDFYHCPTMERSDLFAYGYAFNSRWSERRMSQVTDGDGACLIFDSTKTRRNAGDPMTSLPFWPRHRRGNVLGYADGHAGQALSAGQRQIGAD